MKKMTKLLSVILAFVMALSCMSVMASAAYEKYQTVADLEAKNAYSPYGTVTRLDAETRLSIVFDFLDNTLGAANIYMAPKVPVIGTIVIDLRSVTALCSTIDGFDDLLNGGLTGLVVGALKRNLGILADLQLKNFTNGMTRKGTPNLTIAYQLLKLLSDNKNLVETVLTDGLDLGWLSSAISGVDIVGTINKIAKDIPGALVPFLLSMLSRPDDDATDRISKSNKEASKVVSTLQTFVEDAFKSPMSTTSYRVDASGNDLGYTMSDIPIYDSNPGTAATSRYFVKVDDKTYEQYDYQYAGLLGDPVGGTWEKSETYTIVQEYEGSETFIFRAESGETMKWYKSPDKLGTDGKVQSQYLIPSIAKAMNEGKLSFNINSDDESLASLLYKFLPYIFAEMAPTVLNGSAKKLIAEAFDVEFTELKGDALAEAISATGNPDNFFTRGQEYYLWEYTDYIVVEDDKSYDGYTPYYRYQDKYFKGTVPNNISHYYAMFNWNWEITDDFVNEFIPSSVGSDYIVDNLNDLIGKAIKTMLKDSWNYKGLEYNLSDFVNWQEGGNDQLLENVLNAARGFFSIAPEEILDEYYVDAQFYEPMMNGTLSQAVNGLVCELVKMLMPQIKFPDAIVDEPITAIAAIVVRELCTQLMPTYNFDAMIYDNYGDTSTKGVRKLVSHNADEWLDITLYMGVNLGMYYLRNIADIGEDDTTYGYYSVMQNLGALPALAGTGMEAGDAIEFNAESYKANEGQASWLVMVDWIADWALASTTEWCWRFGNFVNVTGAVDLTTYENPFDKISSVFTNILPELNTLLNTSGLSSAYDSDSLLAKLLKSGLVDSIVKLDVVSLTNILHIPDGSVLRSGKIADTAVKLIAKLLNGLLTKIAGKQLIPDAINSVETLLDHANIRTTVVNLVGQLGTAYNNGLLHTALPLLNFFIGWKTDPQVYADPHLSIASSDLYFAWNSSSSEIMNVNDDYLVTNGGSVTTTLSILNNSSGMLLKHRASAITDSAYDIEITGVSTTSGATVSLGEYPTISPYTNKDVALTISNVSGTQMVDITVAYKFTGKDGQPVGGTQYETIYKLVSDVNYKNEQSGEATKSGQEESTGSGTSKKTSEPPKVKQWSYLKYIVVDNLADVEANFVTFENRDKDSGLINDGKTVWVAILDNAGTTSPFSLDTSVYHGVNVDSEKDENGIGAMKKYDNDGSTWAYYAYKLDDKEYEAKTGDRFSLGYHIGFSNNDLGSWTLSKFAAQFDVSQTVLYYNVDALKPYVEDENLLYAKDYDITKGAAAWSEYLAAVADAAFLVNGPKNYDTFDSLYSEENINKVQARLDAAIKAMDAYEAKAESTGVAKVDTMLKKLEKDPDRDINFQDYRLFEYFKYENERTASREMIKSVTPPAAPEYYIDSVYGNDLVNAIIASDYVQGKEAYRIGVPATKEIDDDTAYQQALANFVPATYKDVAVDNQATLLEYYYNFMINNPKGTPDKTFLDKEITYAEAQNYAQADYSPDSWSAYEDALAEAKKVSADGGATESQIFDVKYALMVAQNNLLAFEKSMKDNTEDYMNEELKQLITVANAIIDQFGGYYTVNPDSGKTDEQALAALVRALGVKYENVEVDKDGIVKKYTGILYDYSALTFVEYDRVNTVKNKRAVDKAADKLREAIAYFKCEAKLVEKNPELDVVADHDNLLVVGFNPNSITKETDLTDKLEKAGPEGSKLEISTSKAGFYGTGTRLDIVASDGTTLVSYFIVIFGDVNGDGAVDAFDALEVDYAYHVGSYHMGDIYDDAADINHDGIVNDVDYGMLVAGVQCTDSISQQLPSVAE